MKISCPACQAKYSIADEKVTDRLAKIRCRKCGATIVIDGKTTPANVYTAAGEAREFRDDLGRKAVRKGRERAVENDAHHFPVPGDRVLPRRRLRHPAVRA